MSIECKGDHLLRVISVKITLCYKQLIRLTAKRKQMKVKIHKGNWLQITLKLRGCMYMRYA